MKQIGDKDEDEKGHVLYKILLYKILKNYKSTIPQ